MRGVYRRNVREDCINNNGELQLRVLGAEGVNHPDLDEQPQTTDSRRRRIICISGVISGVLTRPDTAEHCQQSQTCCYADSQNVKDHHLDKFCAGHDRKAQNRDDGHEIAQGCVLVGNRLGLVARLRVRVILINPELLRLITHIETAIVGEMPPLEEPLGITYCGALGGSLILNSLHHQEDRGSVQARFLPCLFDKTEQ